MKLTYLNRLRLIEMDQLLPTIPQGARVLEFGAGTGQQAKHLSDRGFDVVAIDLESSAYAPHRVFPVQDYDGQFIPLDDHSVDVVFSSNVLEHVEDLSQILSEFQRVTKSRGFGLHVMPTPSWRFWTFLSGFAVALCSLPFLLGDFVLALVGKAPWRNWTARIRLIGGAVLPVGHGTSPEGISELWTFSRRHWRHRFARSGFAVIEDWPIGIFYTGNMLFGDKLALEKRRMLSTYLGSATRVYLVEPLTTGSNESSSVSSARLPRDEINVSGDPVRSKPRPG